MRLLGRAERCQVYQVPSQPFQDITLLFVVQDTAAATVAYRKALSIYRGLLSIQVRVCFAMCCLCS